MKRKVRQPISAMVAPFGYLLLPEEDVAQPRASALRERLFRQIAAKGLRPKHIIDVAAHRGAWSRDVAGVFPKAAVTLIEPQEERAEHLTRFCADHADATWIQAGAGEAKTELPLTLAGRLDGRTLTISEDEAQAQAQGL
ncbi:MAG: hypothetical protein AAFY29_09110 [Pseudomonadota bacterium]